MRLLCATDLSSRSDRAVRRAAALARQRGAELVLLSAVDDDQPEALVESERRQVAALLAEQARAMPEMQGLAPRILVETGAAFAAILRAAEAEAADLVVMGEHRRRLLADIFTGTTVERVMRLGRWPVLMVNRPGELPWRRALAAVDLSEPSAHALRTARALGLLEGVELTVFHAFLQPGRNDMILADIPAEQVKSHLAATAAEARAEVARFLRGLDPGFAHRLPPIALEEGAPTEALRRAADRLSPDLVVLGTRGRGAVGRLLLGSVAEAALRGLACDVLAVPPP
ncbi:universal stress protein [Crenalkalicoccus roseus]|uniref:universal stress protein n=1 Tax=Crenalkalicoccus roseus TaxID=1485588 RepID=UPI0010819BD4|nr:universal stress protein [Crenalkalicoccus roseus]